jgi:hypothetical protein
MEASRPASAEPFAASHKLQYRKPLVIRSASTPCWEAGIGGGGGRGVSLDGA